MKGTIQKWGESQAIRIPQIILKQSNLKSNDAVEITAESDIIIIRKAPQKKHKTLEERLKGFEGEYPFKECDSGAPVGEEAW